MYEYSPALQKTYTKIFQGPARIAREKLHLTPNQISVIGFLFTLVGLGYFYFQYPFIGILLTLVGMLLDGLDGTMARLYNMKTPLGHIFETVFDGTHEILLYPVLAAAGYVHWWLAILASSVFLVIRIWKHYKENIFDAGFKRVSVLFGYFMGFEFVLAITTAWVIFAIVVNTTKLMDVWAQKHTKNTVAA